MGRVLANSINSVEIAQVAHDIVAERWDNWDLTEFLVYLVDTVNASALPYLADQFNVEGLRGFSIANTEQEQRELIKQSIRLHKFMGTPWAIRKSCETVGFPVVILDEGLSSLPPDHNTDWARFRVLVEAPDRPIPASVFTQIRELINIYKPERSHLEELGLYLPFEDTERLFRPDTEERENLEIEIIGEQMEYYPVVVDTFGVWIVDRNNNVISYFI